MKIKSTNTKPQAKEVECVRLLDLLIILFASAGITSIFSIVRRESHTPYAIYHSNDQLRYFPHAFLLLSTFTLGTAMLYGNRFIKISRGHVARVIGILFLWWMILFIWKGAQYTYLLRLYAGHSKAEQFEVLALWPLFHQQKRHRAQSGQYATLEKDFFESNFWITPQIQQANGLTNVAHPYNGYVWKFILEANSNEPTTDWYGLLACPTPYDVKHHYLSFYLTENGTIYVKDLDNDSESKYDNLTTIDIRGWTKIRQLQE